MNLNNELARQIMELMPGEGMMATKVANLSLVRSNDVMQDRCPVMYEPCVYIVVQGKKSAILGGDDYIYDELNYLVLSVPLPLECQILVASPDRPYLAVKIDIDLRLLDELMSEATIKTTGEVIERGIFVSGLGDDIKSTLARLLSYVSQPAKAKVLGELGVKELLFHVLEGAQGDLLRAFAYRDRQSFQIARVINFIQGHYAENLEVADLAQRANMSQSSFHAYFKAVTKSSPIQYIKAIRLHAARRKMLFENRSASDAAFQVGYASPSQFSREYRRMFGVPPTKDIQLAASTGI